jgi:hypothetical protein
MPTTRCKSPKIDLENVQISIILDGEPNSRNPYALLSPEERMKAMELLVGQIYARILQKRQEQTIDKE